MLAAGLDGIEKGYECPETVEENVYQMSEEERNNRGIGMLPESLWEAILVTEGSELVRRALGEHAFDAFIKSKKIEWEEYRAQVNQWELDKYLSVL
jgi:glutamine synthetase